MDDIDRSTPRLQNDRRSSTWFPVLAAAAAVATVLTIGGLFPPGPWFDGLIKPTWQPPSRVFAPVWSVLYAMMAISLGLVLAAPPHGDRRRALWAMGVQLALNAAWTPLFFGLQSPLLGFIDILALWLSSVIAIAAVARVSGLGALLLVPSLLWVSFAVVLNGVIMALNT